jgi:hypothetical protein
MKDRIEERPTDGVNILGCNPDAEKPDRISGMRSQSQSQKFVPNDNNINVNQLLSTLNAPLSYLLQFVVCCLIAQCIRRI